MKAKIKNNEFNVKVASTPQELRKGLLGTDSLPKGEGMVLKFEESGEHPITMVGMKYPLTLIFSNGGKINRVVHAEPGMDNILGKGPVDLVLEINKGEAKGLRPGQSIELIGEKKKDGTVELADGGLTPKGAAHVLDEDGNVQMNLKGGERIYSRKATARMFDLAKRGEDIKLAKHVLNETKAQDNRPAEYAKN